MQPLQFIIILKIIVHITVLLLLIKLQIHQLIILSKFVIPRMLWNSYMELLIISDAMTICTFLVVPLKHSADYITFSNGVILLSENDQIFKKNYYKFLRIIKNF